jgi:hypothetical protein
VNTELPTSLTRFGEALDRAIARELAAAPAVTEPVMRRRLRLAARSGVALATLALLAVAVVSSLGSPATPSAWARQVVERAAAVLAPARSPRTILHLVATQTLSPLARKATAGVPASLSEEAWIQQGAPWAERVLIHTPGGPVFEKSATGQIYNTSSHELYRLAPIPSGEPRYTLAAGTKPSTYLLRVKARHGLSTSTITSAEAKLLRNGTDKVTWSETWDGHVQRLEPLVLPAHMGASTQPNPSSVRFGTQVRALLTSGHARVSRATTADGRPAIEIDSVHPLQGPRTIYYVNPTTYAPIELDTFGFDSPKDVTRIRFSVYQAASLAGHRHLLRFSVPRDARLDRSPADFWHAAGLVLFF